MKKILFFTNVFPYYRKNIWCKLLNQRDFTLKIYYDSSILDGIQSFDGDERSTYKERLFYLKNYAIKGVIFWQSRVIKKCLFSSFDQVIFLGEMNIISTWFAAIFCKLRKKEVIFWSHGLYGNEGKIKLFFRILFYKLADRHLLYEERAKRIMIEKGFPHNRLFVIYNSLDYENQKNLFSQLQAGIQKKNWDFFKNNLPTLVFTGRLTKQKKLSLLINAVTQLNSNKAKFNLLIVGNGPESTTLKSMASDLQNNGLCHFTGAVYNENQLANYIYFSQLCVSPGNVGLTAIHSLTYGTPVCTHNNFSNQMPEVAAIAEFQNGIFFKEDDVESLKARLILWFKKYGGKNTSLKMRGVIDKKYNPNFQVKIFKEALYI